MTGVLRCAATRPTKQMIWAPLYNETPSNFMYHIYFFLYHYVPAFFIDIALRLKGSKLRLVNVYSKIYFQTRLLEFFMSRTWEFENKNMRRMYKEMSEKDHEDFPVRLLEIDYEPHVTKGTEGLMKYFYKENEEDAEIARGRLKMFNALHSSFLIAFYSLLFYFLIKFL